MSRQTEPVVCQRAKEEETAEHVNVTQAHILQCFCSDVCLFFSVDLQCNVEQWTGDHTAQIQFILFSKIPLFLRWTGDPSRVYSVFCRLQHPPRPWSGLSSG